MNVLRLTVAGIAGVFFMASAGAAQGEMGTGVPEFGLYSNAATAGGQAVVWAVQSATTPFPSGCTSITLSANTMGSDSFKQALGVMMTAQAMGKRVRFYAHAPRDAGCGVDYVQMVM